MYSIFDFIIEFDRITSVSYFELAYIKNYYLYKKVQFCNVFPIKLSSWINFLFENSLNHFDGGDNSKIIQVFVFKIALEITIMLVIK
jgi:hypothetical protein